MPYPPDSVVHSFGTDSYRVEFRSTGNSVRARVIEVQTGREVATTELDAGFQLRIQDEQSKAAELVASKQREKEPEPEPAKRPAVDIFAGLPRYSSEREREREPDRGFEMEM